MAAVNEHTRKMITTAVRKNTDAYRDGWDRIFGTRELPTAPQERADEFEGVGEVKDMDDE